MGEWVRLPDELYHHGVKGMKWGVGGIRMRMGHSKIKGNSAPENLISCTRV